MFKLKVKYLEPDKLTLNSDFNNKIYEEEVVNIDFRDIKVDECTFKKIDFNNSTFTDMEFMDTTFEDCILTITLLNNALKIALVRERPEWRLYTPHGYSYPSGHSMSSLAFYGLIIYLIIKYYKGKGKKIIIGLLSVLILIIGLSRIYLGVHFFTDVIGAYLFDIGYLIILITLIENKKIIKEKLCLN